MFERVIESGPVSEIDFGTGNESYKRDWTNSRRELCRLHAFDPGSIRGVVLSTSRQMRVMWQKMTANVRNR
jgi:CelD/BcsL family acetyltransferase involved in cellulose biosynthesis